MIANNKKGEVLDLIERATFYKGIAVGSAGIPDLTPYANKALIYCRRALSLHVYSEYSSIYKCIGDAYTTKGQYQMALYYYKKALNANEKYGKNILLKARIYQDISLVYGFRYTNYKYNSRSSYFKKLAYIYGNKSEELFQNFIKHAKLN